MSTPLQERHPSLMVPIVFTFGVVVYTNGETYHPFTEAVRDAIIKALPPGCGVGPVTCTDHGVYNGNQGALK